MEKYCLKIDFSNMGVVGIRKNQWAAIKILFQTSLSPLGVYSYMEVTKSVQDGIVGSTDRLSLNLNGHNSFSCHGLENQLAKMPVSLPMAL